MKSGPSQKFQSDSDSTPRSRSRLLRGLIAAGGLVLAVAIGWWAGQATLGGGSAADAKPKAHYAKVTEQSVGQTVSLTVTLLQPNVPLAVNLLPGIVTSTGNGGPYSVGDAVYSVAGQGVRVVEGDTPFYRDLTVGESGSDVAELENSLVSLGYLRSADGRFDLATRAAVRAWQAAVGATRTGSIGLGQLVAVPSLPARLNLGSTIVKGALISGGEAAVVGQSGTRDFEAVLSQDQERLIPTDSTFKVDYKSFSWNAVVQSQLINDAGNLVLHLVAPDGGAVCAKDCAELPADPKVSLRAESIVVPSAKGPTVPAAAIRTDSSGASYVTLKGGKKVRVTLVASNDGLAVVKGVEVGALVMLPGSK